MDDGNFFIEYEFAKEHQIREGGWGNINMIYLFYTVYCVDCFELTLILPSTVVMSPLMKPTLPPARKTITLAMRSSMCA
jgi:hypothetical protein